MSKTGEVSFKTNPLKRKASFMVEDLLRSTHDHGTATTDYLSSQQLNADSRWKTSPYLSSSTKEDSRSLSTETSPNGYILSRESQYRQGSSSPASSTLDYTTASLSFDQVHHLEKVFRRQQYLGTKERQRLATTIQATDQQVKKWFQDKRMALKLHIDKAQQRQAKLAYLNSLAQSLLKTPQQENVSPRIARPAVKCYTHHTQVPLSNYGHLELSSRYTRPQRVTPYNFYQPRHRFDALPAIPALPAYTATRYKYPQVLPHLF